MTDRPPSDWDTTKPAPVMTEEFRIVEENNQTKIVVISCIAVASVIALLLIVDNAVSSHTVATAYVQPASPSITRTYSSGELSRIVNASQNNEARFDRDYKGQMFDGVLNFRSAEKSYFGDATAHFTGPYLNDVYCYFHDQRILKQAIDWNPGQPMHVHGVIDTTTLGAVGLDNCRF